MLVCSWPLDTVLLGTRGSPPSVAPPRPAACGLPAGRRTPGQGVAPGRSEGGTCSPERRRRQEIVRVEQYIGFGGLGDGERIEDFGLG
jgi:hypothetical protein